MISCCGGVFLNCGKKIIPYTDSLLGPSSEYHLDELHFFASSVFAALEVSSCVVGSHDPLLSVIKKKSNMRAVRSLLGNK